VRDLHARSPAAAAAAAFDANDAAAGGGGSRGVGRAGVLDSKAVHTALASAVRAAAMRRRLVVIATRHSFGAPAPPAVSPHPGGGVQGGPVYKEYMAKSWQQVVTHRLTMYHSDPGSDRVDLHWAGPHHMPAGELGGCE
jgi:hypothetical protein